MTDKEIIDRLWGWGHFNNPAFPDTLNIQLKDLDTLAITDNPVRQALISYQDFMAQQLEPLSLMHHNRPAVFDGEVGPATADLLAIERCGFPDYHRGPRAAIGTGNWKGCHGVGNFHCAIVKVTNPGACPSHLKPHFDEVKRRISASYAELGLRLIWDDSANVADIEWTFVTTSSGWIGLALLGHGRSCGQTIWCRYYSPFRGQDVLTEWTSLGKHEIGHNCGLEHSRGGVMNPSIIPGLPVSWKGDPSESILRRMFGGVPVDAPLPPPTGPGAKPMVGEILVTIPEGTKPGTYRFVPRSFDGV